MSAKLRSANRFVELIEQGNYMNAVLIVISSSEVVKVKFFK